MKQAYFHSSIPEFLIIGEDEIIGKLNKGATSFVSQWTVTTISWSSSIEILKECFSELISINRSASNWHILLEYEIPRLFSRIDAVIIADDLIFVIEFKYNQKKFEAADVRQVEDYANDLFDFHLESRNKTIIPVLLAPLANPILTAIDSTISFIKPCLKANSKNFSKIINEAYAHYHSNKSLSIDPRKWELSIYEPTPTIIQAAKALFAGQKVETITKSGAEGSDLKRTTDYLLSIIDKAKTDNKKIVCFVTGVPGAGKTLVGLNLVHKNEGFAQEQSNTAYFSGNGPLINVLREALCTDSHEREKLLSKFDSTLKPKHKKEAFNKVKAKIQNLHQFIKDSISKNSPPNERIVVFDEAQRCWNARHFSNKAKQNQNREKNIHIIVEKSEAELLFEFMNRHEGFAVIVALVGGGQEINTGEGGIAEWGKAIQQKYNSWEVYISDELLTGDSATSGQTLFDSVPTNVIIHKNKNLHLSVSQRSFKANNLNVWVNAVLSNEGSLALKLSQSISEKFPLMITRNISTAKEWLKQKKSGNKRIGLVASSGGHRLKPHGIYVGLEIDESTWFLKDECDIRSSYFMELVATEFKVQGLELDWVGVCWDADLRRFNNDWDYKNFAGTNWKKTEINTDQQFILNTYRVLLTRAREGLIVFVPEGDPSDNTRLPQFYDFTYNYLVSCGMKEL